MRSSSVTVGVLTDYDFRGRLVGSSRQYVYRGTCDPVAKKVGEYCAEGQKSTAEKQYGEGYFYAQFESQAAIDTVPVVYKSNCFVCRSPLHYSRSTRVANKVCWMVVWCDRVEDAQRVRTECTILV